MPRTKIVDGNEVPDWDHTKDSLMEAIGYTEEESHDVVKRHNNIMMAESLKNPEKMTDTSYRMQIRYDNFSKIEVMILDFYEAKERHVTSKLREMLGSDTVNPLMALLMKAKEHKIRERCQCATCTPPDTPDKDPDADVPDV